jgi:hypothetical protein
MSKKFLNLNKNVKTNQRGLKIGRPKLKPSSEALANKLHNIKTKIGSFFHKE